MTTTEQRPIKPYTFADNQASRERAMLDRLDRIIELLELLLLPPRASDAAQVVKAVLDDNPGVGTLERLTHE